MYTLEDCVKAKLQELSFLSIKELASQPING